jgi:hypothetical protein
VIGAAGLPSFVHIFGDVFERFIFIQDLRRNNRDT